MKIAAIKPSFQGLLVVPKSKLDKDQINALNKCGENYPGTKKELRIVNDDSAKDYKALGLLKKYGITGFTYINSNCIPKQKACATNLDYNGIINYCNEKSKFYAEA